MQLPTWSLRNMSYRYPKTLFFSVFIIFFSTSIEVTVAGPRPADQVKITVEAVLEVLRDDSLDPESRRTKIRKLVNARFDYREMSKRTLAKNWAKANDEEKESFVELFSQLLEWSYIGRIEAYSNEMVMYQKEIIKGDRAQVNTIIVSGSTDIPIDYRLMKKGDDWFVYDVIIERVSLIRNYRSNYQSIIKNEGMSGLLAKMEQKVEELKAKTE